jgi:hypothetical protein
MLRSLALVLGLALAGCQDGSPPDPSDPDGVDPAVVPPTAPLHRLSIGDYERTLRVLFGDETLDGLQPLLDALPADAAQEEGAFARNDQRLSQQHVDRFYAISDALAQAAAADPTVRQRAGGACADAVEDACLEPFARTFLRRALRRPPTEDEIGEALALMGGFSGNTRIHALVFVTLMRPEFLYHFENRGVVDDEGGVALTAHELASRLSYHFWGEPPDAVLMAAADDGRLLTDEGLRAQVERLYADPRTEATLLRFFDEWLHLHRGDFVDSPRLRTLAGELELDGLPEEMRAEVHDLLVHAMRSEDRTWYDVQTTEESFATGERLAGLYGVPPWDGVGERPLFPAGQRAGLLNRAGMLLTSDGSTNPFRRGIFVKRLMLCEFQEAPPADLPPEALAPPDVGPGATTREAYEAKVQDTQCAGCHATFSPFGYALESYDGLGRYRTDERLVDESGTDHGTAPVDASVAAPLDGAWTRVADGPDLAFQVAATPQADACMARQYFRFAHRRPETEADQPLLDAWSDALAADEPLRDWLKRVALDATFRRRTLED